MHSNRTIPPRHPPDGANVVAMPTTLHVGDQVRGVWPSSAVGTITRLSTIDGTTHVFVRWQDDTGDTGYASAPTAPTQN